METIRNTRLLRKCGNNFRTVSSHKALKNVEIVGFYFSARWCLPCRRFTQLLAEFYNELKWRTEPFEVIFVSLDSNDEEMINYMRESHADWLSISVDRKDNLCDILRDWFGVEGIPALIILRRNGYVITMEGAMDIQVRGIEAFYSWLDGSGITLSPQTVSSLTFDDDDDRCRFCFACCRSY